MMTLDSAATTSALTEDASQASDDGYGWFMFAGFAAAVLAISFAVCALALIGSWVALGIVMIAHFCVTAAMMKMVLGALDSGDDESETETLVVKPATVPVTAVAAPGAMRYA